MTKKLIVFDLFGTLVETPNIREVEDTLNEIEKNCQGEPGLFRRWLETSTERDIGKFNTSDEYWESVKVIDTKKADKLYYKSNSYWLSRERENLEKDLKEIKAMGLDISLCSNAGFEVHSILKELEFYKYFSKISISSEVKSLKPNKEIYLNSIPKKESYSAIIFVGDGGSDELTGAENLGLIPIQISEIKGGETSKFRALNGEYRKVEKIAQLIEIIKRM